jgi:hypothetical protein
MVWEDPMVDYQRRMDEAALLVREAAEGDLSREDRQRLRVRAAELREGWRPPGERRPGFIEAQRRPPAGLVREDPED